MNLRRQAIWIVALCTLALTTRPAFAAAPGDDAYSLRVDRGVVTLDAADLKGLDRARVTDALARVGGVTRVEIREAGAPSLVGSPAPARDAESGQLAVPDELRTGLLPGGQLFKPLIADPRWPHFAAAYRY